MHEWALAEAVVAKVAEVARARGLATVHSVVVGLGELQEVQRDAFEFGLSTSRQGVPELDGTSFALEVEPARCSCRSCGHEWELRDSLALLPEGDRESVHLVPELVPMFVGCPACESPDFEVIGGRGVSIVAID